MKKAKILIPTLSVLCFSTLACVTGSVAWFTSMSNATVNTDEFSIRSVAGAMAISTVKGVGTLVDKNNADGAVEIPGGWKGSGVKVIPDTYTVESAQTPGVLTHGSYDCANRVAWVNEFNSDTNFRKVSDAEANKDNEALFSAGTTGVFHIFSWDMTFEYAWNGVTSGADLNLYFDVTSNVTPSQTVADKDCAKGYRVGFINMTQDDAELGDNWVVWSPLQGKVLDKNPATTPSCYVSAATTMTNYSPLKTGNLIYQNETDSADKVQKITGPTGSKGRKDCLGFFHADTNPEKVVSSITIKAVLWFEGCDANVVTDATNNTKLKAAFNFYLKQNGTDE